MVEMWYVEEIRRCQSLRERAKELRDEALRICAKSREIVDRSNNSKKMDEASPRDNSGRTVQETPSE